MPILCWCSFKHNIMIPIIRLFIFINSFIHVLMYSYYALSSFGPKVQSYLWWKKYITLIQIIQFIICGSYGVLLLIMQTDYPIDWFLFVVGQNPVFLVMFANFYQKAYSRTERKDRNTNLKIK